MIEFISESKETSTATGCELSCLITAAIELGGDCMVPCR